MPGQTTVQDIPYPLISDSPANIETAVKPTADRLEAILTPDGLAAGDVFYWTGSTWSSATFYGEGTFAGRPAANAVPAGFIYRVSSGAGTGDQYLSTGSDWVEIGGGGSMGVVAYLESNAPAGDNTGQTNPGTSYTDLKETTGSPTEVTIPEDGAYEVEVQLAGMASGGNGEAFARVYRVADDGTVLERGWQDAFNAPSSFGTGAAAVSVFGGGHAQPDITRRTVQLSAGDVIRLQIKSDAGTLQLNRDLTWAKLTKVADDGGGTPS